MSNPVNPLDKFVSYTYYFELHAHHSWDELARLDNPSSAATLGNITINGTVSEEATTAATSGDTLLINTRKDAHTIIDDVNFSEVLAGSGNPPMVSFGNLIMTITEPNGILFIEKLKNHLLKLQMLPSDIMQVQFALRVVFVGRDENNFVTINGSPLIPIHLMSMTAKFDLRGGVYHPLFIISTSAAQDNNPLGSAAGKTTSNISFSAGTVQQACKALEARLNADYAKIFATEVANCANAKPLNFVIDIDKKIDGKCDLATKESTAPGALSKFSFNPNTPIIDMVRVIINSSPDLNAKIGASLPNITKQYHPNVNMITITPSYQARDTSIDIVMRIREYVGAGKEIIGDGKTVGNTYEFNYIFAGPGKNVDILDFEIMFTNFIMYIANTTTYGTQLNTNGSGTGSSNVADTKSFSVGNVIHEDSTRFSLTNLPIQKQCIPAEQNSAALLPSNVAQPILSNIPPASIPAASLAFSTVTAGNAAMNMTIAFTIRGNSEILTRCIGSPDGDTMPLGATEGLWIKVNIFDQNHNSFYYTGAYRLLDIQNIFSGGKFTQVLKVLMMDDDTPDSQTSTTAKPGKTAEQIKAAEIKAKLTNAQQASPANAPSKDWSTGPGGAAFGLNKPQKLNLRNF